ncbi:MAG TPA: radical SAM protein, partial [Patescibacteria group bacterium]|nr:radical SAM protein [Patescibacteria group bacterium]
EEALRKEEQERKSQEEEALRTRQEEARKQQEEDQRRRTLQEGDVRIFFDQQNRLHLYYQEQELSKAVGLNAGIFSEGIWHASCDAACHIERPSAHTMRLVLSHQKLPLTQIWDVRLAPEGLLIWKVDMHLREALRIDRKSASLFLSKAYTHWASSLQEGQFPASFGAEWQAVSCCEDNTACIGLYASSYHIPGVTLRNDGKNRAQLRIQNTDTALSARVLELLFEQEPEYYQAGTYPCLKATIQLYPQKAAMEETLKKMRQQQEKMRQAQEAQFVKESEAEKIYVALNDKRMSIFSGAGKDVCVFGDSAQLHAKIGGQDNFKENISRIKKGPKDKLRIAIGVSRFNFFRLHTIAQFYSGLINSRLDLRSLALPLFPVRRLYAHFADYIKELDARLGSGGISFFLQDEKLPGLLSAISSKANRYNERDLLRLLGVIAEHPFIGPQTLVLDTYHRCNTNCIHCWIHTPKRKPSPASDALKMELPLYKKIIDDAAALLCDEIIIQGDGEPLLDNRFMDMVSYARQQGLKTLFFTNGILLDKKKAGQLIDLEVEEVFCSLPAGTAATYAKINAMQPPATFRRIARNLAYLISARNKLKKDKPRLQMTHVIHKLNYDELRQMSELDVSIGADKARFYLARLDENTGFLKLEPRHIGIMQKSLEGASAYLQKHRIALQDNIYFQLKHYNPATGYWSEGAFLKTGCPVGWFFCLVLAKGEVSMCCHLRIVDCLGEHKSLEQIWYSPEYNKLRVQAKYLMKHKDALLPSGVKLYDDFCSRCDTHQVILGIEERFREYGLEQFL